MRDFTGCPDDAVAASVSVDVQSNSVVIKLSDSPYKSSEDVDRLISDLSRRFDVEIDFGGFGYVADAEECTRNSCAPPLRGGLNISCTLGFIFQASNGESRASTAGHCTQNSFSHNGTVIGSTLWSQNSGSVDAKIISIDNLKHWNPDNAVLTASGTAQITSKVGDNLAVPLGTPLCVEGRHGEVCGTLVNNDYSFTENGVARNHFGRMTGDPCSGDSGAPVIFQSGFKAAGLHSRSPDTCHASGRQATFTWVGKIEAATGWTWVVRTS